MNLFDDIINKKAHQRALDGFTAALDALGYPYELLDRSLDSEGVVEVFVSALLSGMREGFSPVLITEEDGLSDFIERYNSSGFSPARSADELREADASALIGAAHRRLEAAFRSQFDDDDEAAEASEDFFFSGGDCDISANDGFSDVFTLFTKRLRLTALVKLPTREPYEAPLYLPDFGSSSGFRPPAKEQSVILKKLYNDFGAVPAVITSQSMELFFPEKLTDEAALSACEALTALLGMPHPKFDEKFDALRLLVGSIKSGRVVRFVWD